MAYGQQDSVGRPYALLTGYSQSDGHNVPLEVEIVPGARVELSDIQVDMGVR